MFAIVKKMNNLYLMECKAKAPRAGIAVWTYYNEPTHQEFMCCHQYGNRRKGTRATLMPWHWRLGHLLFKMVVGLAQSGASKVVTTDLPVKIPSHEVCAASVWGPVCCHQQSEQCLSNVAGGHIL